MKKIKLTQGQFAIVDNEDFERVNQFKWCASWSKTTLSFYAMRTILKSDGKRITRLMHRYIMNVHQGMETDHKNHNTLDNRKSNLRICTKQQNRANRKNHQKTSSKYKGVYWCKDRKKWGAQIKLNKKEINLGRFKFEIDAVKAYNEKAKELFGEFAYLNKIKKER